jgi:hypothetical protein
VNQDTATVVASKIPTASRNVTGRKGTDCFSN